MNDLHPDDMPPLLAWSHTIQTRAKGLNLDKPSALIVIVKNKLGDARASLNEATVKGWLTGHCVPQSPALHTALMEALNFPKMPALQETRKKHYKPLTGLPLRMAQQRQHLEAVYSGFPEHLKVALDDPKPKTVVAAAKKTINPDRRQRAEVKGAFSDSRYVPPRLLDSAHAYEDLPAGERMWMGAATHNVHEFLTLYRLRSKQTHGEADSYEDMAHKLDVSPALIRGMENGKHFPSKAMLGNFKRVMDANDYARLEELTIANRLAYVAGTAQERNDTPHADFDSFNKSIASIMQEMPPVYWRAVIEQFLHPKKFKTRPHKPLWAAQLEPIEYKEDYLRAMRGVLSMTVAEVATEVGCSAGVVSDMEDSAHNPESKTGENIRDYYLKRQIDLQAQELIRQIPLPKVTVFYDAVAYAGLETAYDPSIVTDRRAELKARRSCGNSESPSR